MGMYRISDLNVEINTNSPTVSEAIKRYEVFYDESPNFTLSLTDDVLIELMEEYEGMTADAVETMQIATLYCWALFDFNGFPIRAVAVENDGKCVLFAAPYADEVDLTMFLPKDKIFAVNYPGVRIQDDDYFVFDTPFGFRGLESKTGKKLPLSAIVFYDNQFDSLKKLEPKVFVRMFMRAVAQNIRHERTKHSLFILEKLMHKIDFYGVRDMTDIEFILDRV